MLDNSESFPIELDTRATRSYLTKLENSPRSLTYTYRLLASTIANEIRWYM